MTDRDDGDLDDVGGESIDPNNFDDEETDPIEEARHRLFMVARSGVRFLRALKNLKKANSPWEEGEDEHITELLKKYPKLPGQVRWLAKEAFDCCLELRPTTDAEAWLREQLQEFDAEWGGNEGRQ